MDGLGRSCHITVLMVSVMIIFVGWDSGVSFQRGYVSLSMLVISNEVSELGPSTHR